MKYILVTILLVVLNGYCYAQSPGGVASQLQVWFKADAGTSTTTNGTTVTTWNDQGPYNKNSVLTGTINLPTYTSNWNNFKPAIYFGNGDHSYFEFDLDSIKNSDYTLIAVIERDASNGHSYVLGTHINASNQGLHFGYRSNQIATLAQWGNDVNSSVPAYNSPQDFTILLGELNTGSGKTISETRNGATSSNSHSNTTPLGGTAIGTIGRGYPGGFEGYIAEVIAYNSTLTATEIAQIYSYLGFKYGQTLDQNYLASDGTVLWNKITNATYHNNLLAIGRDDNSGYQSTQSKSANNNSGLTIVKNSAFTNNLSFLVAGSNGLNSTTTSNIPTGIQNRSQSIWKTETQGTIGAVDLKFNLSEMGINNSGNALNYALLIDTDTDFTSGATVINSGVSLVGDTLIFNGVTLTDGYFSLGTQIEFTAPGGIFSDLAIWLKADSGTSTTTSGAFVTSWNDISGHGNHATQAGSSNFPTYINNKYNFNPSISFPNGDNGYYEINLDDIKNSDYTLITVQERTSGNTNNYILGTTSTTNNESLHFGYRNGSQATLAHYGNDVNLTVNSYNAPRTLSILTGTYSSTTGKQLTEIKDGTSLSNTSSNTSALSGNSPGALGRGFNSQGFKGFCSEIIAYNSTLSATELQKVYTYIGIKYGLTIPQNYISSSGIILWNNTSNTSFNNDLVGIGKDVSSGLAQNKSMSINENTGILIQKPGGFSNDESFLIFGSNQLSSTNTTNVPSGYNTITNRIWRTDATNSISGITVKLLFNEIGLPNTGDASDYVALKDTDTDFTSGATQVTSGISISGDTLILTGMSFNDGYFAVASTYFTYAPGGVSQNLQYWFKANDGTSTTTDGASITQWNDQSGFNHNATQTGSSDAPIYKASVFNDNPAVYFSNGDNGYFELNLDQIKNSDYTLIGVVERDNSNNNCYLLGTNSNVSHTGLQFGYRSNATATLAHWGNDVNLTTAAYNAPLAPSILRGELNTSSGKSIYETKNGVLLSNSHGTTTALSGTASGNIGHAYPGGFEGYIAEIIGYNSTLSATDIAKIYSYIGIKYSIPSTYDYLSSDGATLWSTSTNSDFKHNIAGIAKDDNSELSQAMSTDRADQLRMKIQATGTLDDMEYLIWGSNNLNSNSTNDNAPATYTSKLNKIWKIQESGETGNLTITIDLTGLTNLPTNASDFALIIDTDTLFSDGNTITASNLNGNELQFNNVNLNNNSYVTLAVWQSIVWDGSAFSNGTGTANAPSTADDHRKLFINGNNAVISEPAEVSSMIVSPGASVTILNNQSITVSGSIENNGQVTVENSGSLIQTHSGSDENSGSGNYTVKRTGETDILVYDAWGSPVQNQDILGANGVFDGTNPCDIYTFLGNIQQWKYDYPLGFNTVCNGNNVTFTSNFLMATGDGVMDEARGYFVPGAANPTREFNGKINNGEIQFPVSPGPNPGSVWSGDNWNLISNPYPSALDAASFVAANSSLITSNLYFWNQSSANNRTESDYVVWNAAGTVNNNAGVAQPFGSIASGQGFYVESTSAGNLVFTNSMRNSSNNSFFKNETKNHERFWISAYNPTGKKVQSLVAFKPDATSGFDKKYDAKYLEGSSTHHFYTRLNEENMVIQGLPTLEFNTSLSIPLGIECEEAGKYRFSIDKKENITGNLYFIDIATNTTYDLDKVIPEFLLDTVSDYSNRFYIQYHKYEDLQDSTTTHIEEKNQNNLSIIQNEWGYSIQTLDRTNLNNVEVIDLLGRSLFNKQNVGSTLQLPFEKQKHIILRITQSDGKITTKSLVR